MCTRYPIINRVSELKVHIELTRFVQPEKIEIDANEKAVNEKSQYCFFVCTTFDSFLNDFRMLISQQSSTTPVWPAESINTKTEVFFMRELKNTKIIAVDHGYGNMKTANTVTSTGIKAYETEPIFTGNILEYNGIYYRIGEGTKNLSRIKLWTKNIIFWR